MDINLQGDFDGVETARRILAEQSVPIIYVGIFWKAKPLKGRDRQRPLIPQAIHKVQRPVHHYRL